MEEYPIEEFGEGHMELNEEYGTWEDSVKHDNPKTLNMTPKEEFKILALRRESLENQINNIFNVTQKEIFKQQIANVNLKIDKILDEYNFKKHGLTI